MLTAFYPALRQNTRKISFTTVVGDFLEVRQLACLPPQRPRQHPKIDKPVAKFKNPKTFRSN
jgi:hypothetical protein